MDMQREIDLITRKLAQLRKASNALFSSQVELKINLQIIQEQQEEIHLRHQYINAFADFIQSEFPKS